jgi:hypothetical protein
VFGKDALRIVDYYGSIAAGESVPHVVLCEAGGVLCGMEEEARTTYSNVGADRDLPQEVFTHFYQFIAMQPGSCSPCTPYINRKSVDKNLVDFFLKVLTPPLYVICYMLYGIHVY